MDRSRVSFAFLLYCALVSLLRSAYFTVVIIYYINIVGLNPFQLVFVGTVLMITILLSEVPTGVVADLFSRRLSVVIGTALIGVGFLVEASFPTFAGVLAAQVIWGLGITFTSGALEAWVADEAPGPGLDRLFIRGGQVGAVGELAGIGLGVALAQLGLQPALQITAVAMIIFAVVMRLLMPERNFKPHQRGEGSLWGAAIATARTGVGVVRGSPVLRVVMWVTLFFALASESFDRLWQVHFLAHIPFPAAVTLDAVTWFGLLSGVALLLSVVAGELVQRRLHGGEQRLIWTLLIVIGLIMLGMLGFSMANGFAMGAVAFWLAYLLRRVYVPLYTAWINQHSGGPARATVNSFAGQVDAIGQIFGGPAFGFLATVASTRASLALASLALIPAILALLPLLRSRSAAPSVVVAE